MGKLKDLMLEEMKLRNLSPRTIRAYMSHMERHTKLFGKSHASMGEVEIRKYLRYLTVTSIQRAFKDAKKKLA